MKKVLKHLATFFISGLITILPLVITFALLGWIYGKLVSIFGKDSAIGGALTQLAAAMHFSDTLTLVIAYVFIIFVIVLLGMYVHKRASNRVSGWIKGTMSKFPVVNSIYNSVEQVVGIFGKTGDKDKDDPTRSSKIVLVKFANTLVFGMLPAANPIYIGGVPYFMVYFPSTPVPMSGFNYLIPADSVFLTKCTFDDLTKVLVSLGALAPQVLGDNVELIPVLQGDEESALESVVENDFPTDN